MSGLVVILTSCPPDRADAIATHLVEGRHAACVSALPNAQSTYIWQGKLQREVETLLLVKVPREGLDACLAALTAVHPYAVPELLVLPAERVNAGYLAWALGTISGPPDRAQP